MKRSGKSLKQLKLMLQMHNRQLIIEPLYFLLKGTRLQKQAQISILNRHNINVAYVKIQPALDDPEIVKKALSVFWWEKVSGWWRYQKEFIELGICTKEEFHQAKQEFFGGGFWNWLEKLFGRKKT